MLHNSSEQQVDLVYRKTLRIWNIPSGYFSIKFDRHQLNFRATEKEAPASLSTS